LTGEGAVGACAIPLSGEEGEENPGGTLRAQRGEEMDGMKISHRE